MRHFNLTVQYQILLQDQIIQVKSIKFLNLTTYAEMKLFNDDKKVTCQPPSIPPLNTTLDGPFHSPCTQHLT